MREALESSATRCFETQADAGRLLEAPPFPKGASGKLRPDHVPQFLHKPAHPPSLRRRHRKPIVSLIP